MLAFLATVASDAADGNNRIPTLIATRFLQSSNSSNFSNSSGCTDPVAVNWDPDYDPSDNTTNVTVTGNGCVYAGCTDPAAANYNASSAADDGSCAVAGLPCADLTATQCCEEQRGVVMADEAMLCREQIIQLHALLYAGNYGHSCPVQPVASVCN